MKDKNEIRVKVHRLIRTAGDPPTAEQSAQIDALALATRERKKR